MSKEADAIYGEKAGLYIHFPFCRRKRPYCHFASGPKRPGDFDKWRRGLEREADRYAEGGLEFDTLYIGGARDGFLIREGRSLRIPADRLLVSNAILSRFA